MKGDPSSPSPETKECNTEEGAVEGRSSPLAPGALGIIHNLSQAYFKTTRRNYLTCCGRHFSEKLLWWSFSTGHVYDLLASCRPIRECLRVKRFIPGQTPARGAGRSPVHHRRTYRVSARLCSTVLCYLAYFSFFSNGPFPNWSSSCELMVDGGRWE